MLMAAAGPLGRHRHWAGGRAATAAREGTASGPRAELRDCLPTGGASAAPRATPCGACDLTVEQNARPHATVGGCKLPSPGDQAAAVPRQSPSRTGEPSFPGRRNVVRVPLPPGWLNAAFETCSSLLPFFFLKICLSLLQLLHYSFQTQVQNQGRNAAGKVGT